MWISKSQLDACVNITYRAFIHNYQDHIWRVLYSNREFTQCTESSCNIIQVLLANNFNSFTDYMSSPSDQKVIDHSTQITVDLNNMQDNLQQIKTEKGSEFVGGIFLEAVEFMINEFAVDT